MHKNKKATLLQKVINNQVQSAIAIGTFLTEKNAKTKEITKAKAKARPLAISEL